MDGRASTCVSALRAPARETRLRRQSRLARSEVVWTLIAFMGAQAALVAVIDSRHPELYDPECGARIGLLQERRAEFPGRPLLAVVGSSRIGRGFRPEGLPPLTTPAGETALPFNMAHLAGGPRMSLIALERMLRMDVRPRWLVVEIVPAILLHESRMAVSSSAAGDLPHLQKYDPLWQVYGIYSRGRLNAWFKFRMGILRKFAPAWATSAAASDFVTLDPQGGDTAWLAEKTVSASELQRRIEIDRQGMLQSFARGRIDAGADRALRDILDRCRREKIQVVLLLTPESSAYRSWYPASFREQFDHYLHGLAQDYVLAVVDSRSWVPDQHFSDSNHLLVSGADLFTRRLGNEVLRPLVEGRFHGTQLLVVDSLNSAAGPLAKHD